MPRDLSRGRGLGSRRGDDTQGVAKGHTSIFLDSRHEDAVASQRTFDVTIEGTLVLDDFDICAAAGACYAALDPSFSVSVAAGQLDIAFAKALDNPT